MSQPPSSPYLPPSPVPGAPLGPGGANLAPRVSSAEAPSLFNGSTVHGVMGRKGIRHPWELPLVVVAALFTLVAYGIWLVLVVRVVGDLANGVEPSILDDDSGLLTQIFVIVMIMPVAIWVLRALTYAQMRASSVRMSPTQFPEGYRMVVEAARHHGMRRVPDAYVALGNGTINAFASGHGFRRFVVIYSDLFEVGGQVRDPEALRFIIGHEVGHLAAGHTSYFRLLLTNLVYQVPLLGAALSRTQEYTADNYGYSVSPQGSVGAMAVLGAGKYLNADVNVHELADRAVTERGLWLHIVNWQASHPILTWRTHALRDRSRAGKLWFRPGFSGWPGAASAPRFGGPLPPGSVFSKPWPTPDEVLTMLDAADRARPADVSPQFGRFPGVDYSTTPPMRSVQTAVPLLSRPLDPQSGYRLPPRPGPQSGAAYGPGPGAPVPPAAGPQDGPQPRS